MSCLKSDPERFRWLLAKQPRSNCRIDFQNNPISFLIFSRLLKLPLLIFFILSALFLFGENDDAQPDEKNWQLQEDENGLTVFLDVPAGYYAYESSTMPEIQPEAKPDEVPPAVQKKDPFSDDIMNVYEGGAELRWHYPADALKRPYQVKVGWQFCRTGKDAACLLPGTAVLKLPDKQNEAGQMQGPGPSASAAKHIPSYKVLRTATGYQSVNEFRSFLTGEQKNGTFFTGRGLLFSLLLAFLGGLALNLTPCVLPMIPVNLVIIGGKAETKSGRIGRGILYGAGITAAYGALGVIAVLTGGTFGAIASGGFFNLFAAVIFLLLGLAMFDVIYFDLSRYSGKFRIPASAGYAGVFLMGTLAALLAGACVAPVITAALLRAAAMAAEGDYSGLLLPVFAGAGMAAPWPFAAAGLSLFPKPGAWMKHVKHGLGILIFFLSLYYFWTGGQILTAEFSAGIRDETQPSAAYGKIRQAMVESEKTGKPVLLDFGASWCKACKLMEHSVLKDEDIQNDLKNVILCKIAAENPSDPEMAALLKQFNVTGLPTFILIRPE